MGDRRRRDFLFVRLETEDLFQKVLDHYVARQLLLPEADPAAGALYEVPTPGPMLRPFVHARAAECVAAGCYHCPWVQRRKEAYGANRQR